MSPDPQEPVAHYTTAQVARLLGLAVRSVQLMVDRGDLQGWKTAGGHRRIAADSVSRWLDVQRLGGACAGLGAAPTPRILLIEDSRHFQNLASLLIGQHFPGVSLSVADNGITGLAMVGELQPDVLIIDIILPGIDGHTLINTLRSEARFKDSRLVVLTALDQAQRQPFRQALEGLPVIHKPRVVQELPALLRKVLGPGPSAQATAASDAPALS